MKLCPLFESIETPDTIKGRFQSELYWTGIHAANAHLPSEAIEAAIVSLECNVASLIELSCVETVDDLGGGLVQDRAMLLQKHIEQLRALLPEGD